MKRHCRFLVFLFPALLEIGVAGCGKGQKTVEPQEEQTAAPADFGEFTVSTSGKERSIDMTQFKKTVLNIAYAGTQNSRQTLDITYPNHSTPPYKTIVLFHGGGWMAGHKQSETIASIFQAVHQGYAVVSVNYRLSGEVKWPKPLHDAKAAIRFLRANSQKYQLDTEKLVVWGASAGGHIAEMLAATNHQPAFEDLSMGNKTASSAVQGVVAWYGVADVSTLTDIGLPPANKIMGFDVRVEKAKTRDANPLDLVSKNFPPILLVHGTNDKVVPFQQSVDMQKKVNEATGKQLAQLVPFEGASHGDPVIKTNRNVAENLNFVDRLLYPGGVNPHRSKNYVKIKLKE
ncbi:alpha/beta hydrolase [Rufibacter latericius]|uniref:Alpha/beta hydrolase n=1 Tax=Rufibacter latericius TaxID=2487040 RepID=A0A3M9N184_9BACT|nr:alpha/beta hydrolase [Rufibacter latericius]RNI31530.1 alpha/beta hydrolase [Rufibacter latericius]